MKLRHAGESGMAGPLVHSLTFATRNIAPFYPDRSKVPMLRFYRWLLGDADIGRMLFGGTTMPHTRYTAYECADNRFNAGHMAATCRNT